MNAQAKKERVFLDIIKHAHNNKGLFKESSKDNHDGIWLQFAFENESGVAMFSHMLQVNNLGKCTKLGAKGSKEINVLM